MSRHVHAAAGLVLLSPALILVSSGLLGLDRPGALVHPVLVMGGLALALTVNALPVLRIRVRGEGESLVGTIAVRTRGAALNLLALAAGGVLLATITAYLFLENFQPR
jgi:hypothetical protein